MTKQLFRTLGVVLWAAISLCAQGIPMSVHVPFGFYVGKSILPSGDYTVDRVSPSVVRVRSVDCKSSVMIQANATSSFPTPSEDKLVFNRYGDEYYLSQIWRAGYDTGRELLKTRREVEIAAKMRSGAEAVIARR